MSVPTREQLVEIVKQVFRKNGQRYNHERSGKELRKIPFANPDSELTKFQTCLIDAGIECWCACPDIMVFHDGQGVLYGTWENIKTRRKLIFQKEFEAHITNMRSKTPRFLENADLYADVFCRHRASVLSPVHQSSMILLARGVMDPKEKYCGPLDHSLSDLIQKSSREMVG